MLTMFGLILKDEIMVKVVKKSRIA